MKKIIFCSCLLLLFCHGYSQMLAPMNNSADYVTFYALGSVSGSNDDVTKTITASGRLGVEISPTEKLNISIGANLLNANPTSKIKKDSVDFNSLMFPESGNFGFLFNPSFKLTRKGDYQHTVWLDGTFAFRRVSVDSPDVNFKINTANVGVKYMWNFNIGDEDNFIFTFMPYWNLFNIPNEDVKRFNAVLNDPLFEKTVKGAAIHSFGAKTTVQYKTMVFYADLRSNLKTKELNDDNPFKGTKFNIGFSTYLQLKSLN